VSIAPRPAAGVHLFYLDDAGVLFSQARQELHLLNPTATLIWTLFEESQEEDAIVSSLCAARGIEADLARKWVDAALGEWRAKGFLHGDGPRVQPAARVEACAEAPLVTGATYAEHRYRILSSRIAIRFSGAAQIETVAPMLEHLADDESAGATTSVIDIVESNAVMSIYRDAAFVGRCAALDALAPIVKSAVWMSVLRDQRYFLDIHAGVISDGARCLLLPAAAESGKSTLTAALVHAGFEFFSDEIALLEDVALGVLPVPLALCVKDSGIDALADRFPRLRELPVHKRGDGKRVVYMAPPRVSRSRSEAARPVAALVFPRFVRASATRLAPLAKTDALQALMSQCLQVAERLEVGRVGRLVQWLSRIPCYTLEFGDTDSAVGALTALFPLRPPIDTLSSTTAGPGVEDPYDGPRQPGDVEA
jgi:hypothetical protein